MRSVAARLEENFRLPAHRRARIEEVQLFLRGGLDLAGLGIPTELEFVAHYRDSGGNPSGLSPFHFAFSFMRWSVIFEGIAARARHGNAVNSRAQTVGALATPMALRGLEALQ